VIDPGTGTFYVVVKSREIAGSTTSYFHRLHALDIATGAEKFGGPVALQASVPGTGIGSAGGQLPFNAARQNQRAALLLSNGVVYVAFAAHSDVQPYHGWVFGYNATTLQQTLVFNLTPNNEGGGIWQSGGGPLPTPPETSTSPPETEPSLPTSEASTMEQLREAESCRQHPGLFHTLQSACTGLG